MGVFGRARDYIEKKRCVLARRNALPGDSGEAGSGNGERIAPATETIAGKSAPQNEDSAVDKQSEAVNTAEGDTPTAVDDNAEIDAAINAAVQEEKQEKRVARYVLHQAYTVQFVIIVFGAYVVFGLPYIAVMVWPSGDAYQQKQYLSAMLDWYQHAGQSIVGDPLIMLNTLALAFLAAFVFITFGSRHDKTWQGLRVDGVIEGWCRNVAAVTILCNLLVCYAVCRQKGFVALPPYLISIVLLFLCGSLSCRAFGFSLARQIRDLKKQKEEMKNERAEFAYGRKKVVGSTVFYVVSIGCGVGGFWIIGGVRTELSSVIQMSSTMSFLMLSVHFGVIIGADRNRIPRTALSAMDLLFSGVYISTLIDSIRGNMPLIMMIVVVLLEACFLLPYFVFGVLRLFDDLLCPLLLKNGKRLKRRYYGAREIRGCRFLFRVRECCLYVSILPILGAIYGWVLSREIKRCDKRIAELTAFLEKQKGSAPTL
ncbi:hypothetical protein [Trueperella sp. LYQ141]|uniref:hypothetical protein n=1 Tax=Trueperella sp. LYQ141 TaxID=3391058 RepID=UPI003983003D